MNDGGLHDRLTFLDLTACARVLPICISDIPTTRRSYGGSGSYPSFCSENKREAEPRSAAQAIERCLLIREIAGGPLQTSDNLQSPKLLVRKRSPGIAPSGQERTLRLRKKATPVSGRRFHKIR